MRNINNKSKRVEWAEDILKQQYKSGATNFFIQSKATEESIWEAYIKDTMVYHENIFGVHFKEEYKMNKTIAAVYEKTVDAMLVDKFFHNEISTSFTGELLLKQNKEAYLAEANKREKELNAKV